MMRILAYAAALSCALAAFGARAWACGAPPEQTPPPPPPDPPIVCCIVIDWFVDPDDPAFERIIVRYFRQDGGPLYQSNPMPLTPNQRCVCAVPPLPSAALNAGAQAVSLTFGRPFPIPWQGIPPNVPGYGPFVRSTGGGLIPQANAFFQAYAAAAGPTVVPPDTGAAELWTFGGPGQIPPDSFFDIFVELQVPRGFDPRVLCVPGQMWMLALFLAEGNQLLAEPIAPGQPPIPLPLFVPNPGQSAFYKFKWYPTIVPPPCPPPCVGDLNGDNLRDFGDLNIFLGFFNQPCPPIVP